MGFFESSSPSLHAVSSRQARRVELALSLLAVELALYRDRLRGLLCPTFAGAQQVGVHPQGGSCLGPQPSSFPAVSTPTRDASWVLPPNGQFVHEHYLAFSPTTWKMNGVALRSQLWRQACLAKITVFSQDHTAEKWPHWDLSPPPPRSLPALTPGRTSSLSNTEQFLCYRWGEGRREPGAICETSLLFHPLFHPHAHLQTPRVVQCRAKQLGTQHHKPSFSASIWQPLGKSGLPRCTNGLSDCLPKGVQHLRVPSRALLWAL